MAFGSRLINTNSGGGGISYVGSDFTTSGSGRATSLNVPIPATRSTGDLMVVFMTTSYGTYSQSNAGSGFTFVYQNGSGSNEVFYGLYYKISDGTEPATINFTAPANEHLNAHCIVLRGTATSNPINVGTDVIISSGFTGTHNGFSGNDTDANLFFALQRDYTVTSYNITPSSDFDIQNFVKNGGTLSTSSNCFLALRNQDTVTSAAQAVGWGVNTGGTSRTIANQFRILSA